MQPRQCRGKFSISDLVETKTAHIHSIDSLRSVLRRDFVQMHSAMFCVRRFLEPVTDHLEMTDYLVGNGSDLLPQLMRTSVH